MKKETIIDAEIINAEIINAEITETNGKLEVSPISLVPVGLEPTMTLEEYQEQEQAEQAELGGRKYLPYCYFTNGKNCDASMKKRALWICDNRVKRPVTVPFLVSSIAMRDTYRPLKEGNTYDRQNNSYSAVKGYDCLTADIYKATLTRVEKMTNKSAQADELKRFGVTHLFYLLEENSVKIVTAEAFKGDKSYWAKLLLAAKAAEEMGAMVVTEDHSEYTRRGANGTYLDHAKFNVGGKDFKVRPLTDREKKFMKRCLCDNEELITEFLEK